MIVQKNGELMIKAEQIIDEAYNRGKNDAKREISLSGEYTEANCGECHRRYCCEESPDSCTYAKIAQAEPEQEMTLDEAIAHAEDAAEYNAAKATNNPDSVDAQACRQSAVEHRQLAEWLKELKERRAKE